MGEIKALQKSRNPTINDRASDIKTAKVTSQQLNFLDTQGYLIIPGVLNDAEIHELKLKLEKIRKSEGPRTGEFGFSHIRESLLKNKSRIRLKAFDLFFIVLRSIVSLFMILIPSMKKIRLTSKSGLLGSSFSWKSELRQMLIAIREQFDETDERICDLVNKGEIFTIFIRNQLVLEAVKHVIGNDFKLSSLNVRSPKKNNRKQGMHVDWPWPVGREESYACNALWLLDDMNESNGSTRLIPGSHKWPKLPSDDMPNLKESHPGEIYIQASAGDVLLLNSHVWHGGTVNVSGEPRTVIQSYFVHKAHPSQQVQRDQVRPQTLQYLNDDDLQVLDILKK